MLTSQWFNTLRSDVPIAYKIYNANISTLTDSFIGKLYKSQRQASSEHWDVHNWVNLILSIKYCAYNMKRSVQTREQWAQIERYERRFTNFLRCQTFQHAFLHNFRVRLGVLICDECLYLSTGVCFLAVWVWGTSDVSTLQDEIMSKQSYYL